MPSAEPKITIPVYKPSLDGNERAYVNECLESTWISSKGVFIPRFEDAFAKYLGVNHATTICNGTAALHVALLTLGIRPGDEVIVPTFTYIASVNAITYTGATPVFVDSCKETWQMDPVDVEAKLTPRTKAVMAVHLYGHPCDMDKLIRLTRKHNIFLVEDCAEAFGSKYDDHFVGTVGDIGAFSFFGNKTITCGEGGMVVTNDKTLHDRAVHFKGQGLAQHREYWHDIVGYNYRMTNVAAAIGLAQLERADQLIRKKVDIAHLYNAGLEGLAVQTHRPHGPVFHSYWMYSILVENAMLRDKVREHLRSLGIETRPTFSPAHTMPMYASQFQRFPAAEALGWRGINLPSWPDLRKEDIQMITREIGVALLTPPPY